MMKFLYRQNANSLGSWRIWSDENTIHIAHATVLGGSEVFHTELVPEGLAGRSLSEQIRSRMDSRISRMRDRGYKDTVDEAERDSNNQMGLFRPMLAQSVEKVSNIDYVGAVQQKKLDGHRCMITKQDGGIVAYSRQGKEISSITHILGPLRNAIPEGTTLDGELYCHGQSLQTLASWIKRKQPNTDLLSFVCYDLIAPDSYKDRHAELCAIVKGLNTERVGQILPLPYAPYIDAASMYAEMHRVRRAGFEGLILRLDGRSYEAGKRSSGLLKVKHFHDSEFKCIGVEPSADGWGICVCLADNGKEFRTSAPGTHLEKLEVLRNKENYIGKWLTVEYSQLTVEGIPFHASAKCWRDDV
jgi:DNA ligase-1